MFFKHFPLLYIAWLYVFSTKDKIVFFMQQFASLIISLSIAVIIACLSVMNGFNQQVRETILDNIAPIGIEMKLINSDNNIEKAQSFNEGFERLAIDDDNISYIDYQRLQNTFFEVNGVLYPVVIYEDPKQINPIQINEYTQKRFFNRQSLTNSHLIVFDPQSYNGFIGTFSRFKDYKNLEINNRREDGFIFSLSSSEYKKIFHNTNYNIASIYLNNIDQINDTIQKIKQNIPPDEKNKINIISWEERDLPTINLIKLQKKIFLLIYAIMFLLLTAIIVSINVAFFKEKRKDWALYKILDVTPLCVEKIYLYKSLIMFFLSTSLGFILGALLSVYSNEIIASMDYTIHMYSTLQNMFGSNKITYKFSLNDFILVACFSFSIFVLNFFILVTIFRHENIAKFLKGPV